MELSMENWEKINTWGALSNNFLKMDIENIKSWATQPDVCRCCLSTRGSWDMLAGYLNEAGEKQTYSEILHSCFGISLSSLIEWGPGRLICNLCVNRLLDANTFKKQVVQAEHHFVTYNGRQVNAKEATVDCTPELQNEAENDIAESSNENLDYSSETEVRPLVKSATKRKRKNTRNDSKLGVNHENVDEVEVIQTGIDENQGKTAKRPEGRVRKTASKKTKKSEVKAKHERLTIILQCCRISPFKYKKNRFICIYCDKGFVDPAKLREHYSEHENVKPAQIKKAFISCNVRKDSMKADITGASCKICDATIDSSLECLVRHISEKHRKKIAPNMNVGIIPFKMSLGQYRCIVCGINYDEYINLKRHMNVHYATFVCEQCDARFMTAEILRVHSFTHVKESVPCEVCGKVFRSEGYKKKHFDSVHMKKKTHGCLQCSETFVNHYQKLKHISSVHGVKLKQHKCHLCPRVYDLSGKLQEHIRITHLGEKRKRKKKVSKFSGSHSTGISTDLGIRDVSRFDAPNTILYEKAVTAQTNG